MALPLVEGQTLASGREGAGTGALVRGIRPDDLTKLSVVSSNIRSGDMVGFATGQGVLIGSRMAAQLGLAAGDTSLFDADVPYACVNVGDGDSLLFLVLSHTELPALKLLP